MSDLSQCISNFKASANIPPQASQFIKQIDGTANVYTFAVKPGVVMVYRYDVELSDKVKGKSLTKGAGDDGKRGLLRDICFELVKEVFENTQGFGSNGKVLFVYDNRKILFTNCRVPPLTCEIKPERMSEFCRKFLYNATITFELQPCKASHELNLNDIESALCPAPNIQADHSLRTFLEMLTSQPFINERTHRIVGSGRLFEVAEAKRLNDAITTHNGVAKGVRIIVNGGVKPCPALVADVKTCAFFVAGNLGEIAKAMIQSAVNRRQNPLRMNDRKAMEAFWMDFGHLYKGISAYLTYAPSRVIVIDSITARLVSEISFEVAGKNVSMVQYFAEKKKVKIDGNMPAVRQHVDRDVLYPLQCLQILPFQRVSLDKMQMTEDMARISSDLLAANAVNPDVRSELIKEQMRRIGRDGECAKFMFHFGVKLRGDQNNVQIGLRKLPIISFGNTQATPNEKGSFDVRGPLRYLEPSDVLRSWIVAYPRRVTQDKFGKFIADIQRMASQRGMKLPQPNYENVELNAFEQRFEEFSKAKIQFVMYIDEPKLKLCERRYSVLTQHVNVEMIRKAGPASVSNVLNKMNMKLFGLNYMPIFDPVTKNKLDLGSGDILVLGIDTSRPTRATAFEKFKLSKQGMEGFTSEDPLTIGYCGNYLANPVKFVGDYVYQPCKQDVLDVDFFGERIKWIVGALKTNRKKLPSTVFIIRDGISEGMVPNAVNGEFTGIMQVFNSCNQDWAPKFVFVIVDKRHTKRFFFNTGPNRNTAPGSVIDKKIVRVDLHEFFLQSHFPLKGTSKIPQYMIPINEIRANNDELQAFILCLCNMWQIVNMPPALPSPVLQAKELAKRGSNNYLEMKRTNPQYIPRVTGERKINFVQLNERVPYGNSVLGRTRFNA